MKFKQIYVLPLLTVSLLTTIETYAQFALGDIAFSAYNSDSTVPSGTNNDAFTIVLLRDVTVGEQISFTENGWFAAGGFRPGENTFTFTFANNYSLGTQISLSAEPFEALDQFNNIAGTLTGDPLSLAISGDQIFAYNPTNLPTADNESGFIAAIHMNGDWDSDSTSSTTSAKPNVFTDGVNSISINPEVDNARLTTSSCNNFTSVSTLRTLLNTSSNWETNNDIGYSQVPPTCNFLTTLSIGNDQFYDNTITVYPNPSNGNISIKNLGIALNNISILDLNGSKIFNKEINSTIKNIDLNLKLSTGIYLIKLTSINASTIKKIIIK